MDEHSRFRAPILAVVCLGYIALRLWGLADSCLWFDEIFSVHAAEHSWNDILWFVAQDLIHPPLFYLLLKLWMSIGGDSLYWLRLFPVVFSVLALAPFYLLCRELKLKFTSILFALVFFSVNGALIKYAQEVRMYSLLLFLSLVSLWLFSRFFFRGKNIWILTIINLLMVYTHYYGWFVVAAEVLAIFIFQRIKIRHVLIMLAIEIAAFVPWVWGLWKASAAGSDVSQNIGWIQRPGFQAIDFLFDVVEPFYFQQSSNETTSLLYISVPILLIIAAAKVICLANWKMQERKNVFYLLSVFIALPVLLALALSWILPVSIWGSRHLIIVFAPASILAAMFVSGIDLKVVRYVLVGAVLCILTVAFAIRVQKDSESFIWCAWEEVVEPIKPTKEEALYTFEDLSAYHLWFATRREAPSVVKVNGVPNMVEDTAYFLPRGFEGVRKIDGNELSGERFQFAFRDTEWNEKHPPLDYLRQRGYKVQQIAVSERAQGMKAFIGEAHR